MLDAAELRRASATDAGAVAQYLRAIDSDELDALLDAFADAERKKKDDGDALEWRALVHVLLRTSATRQRTATRILQSLWRGHASEMEALRWVSEISLAYMASVASPPESERDAGISAELRVVLQIALQFVRDAMAATKNKALPQLLALVPVLLQLLAEATTAAESADDAPSESLSIVHEHVVQLLELPWDLRSVPYLLELLREHTTLVSKSGWTQLRQSVEQLLTASDLPTECINPLVRECLLLAASCGGADVAEEAAAWIHVARRLLRRLPGYMRQEAEFNMHMSLHQYPSLASVICDVLLASTSPPLDASDAVLLLHAIRASKPLLHHHLVGSALAATANDRASVFSKAQRLILRVLDPPAAIATDSESNKSLRQTVTSILEFGGRQLHARIWKAQLLHELARLWASDPEPRSRTASQSKADVDMGVRVTESVFTTVPEVREEILQSLLESSRVATQSERALEQLSRLVRHHKNAVAPFRQLLEDWLSSLASVPHHAPQLQQAFSSLAPLVASLKDFYSFAMVLLRKHLSSPHTSDRQLATDVWCTWLETDLALDPQQQEEVVLAIKHAVQLSHDRAWTFRRLAQLFHSRRGETATSSESMGPLRLHEASLAEFHRLFASALREFVEPIGTTVPGDSDNASDSDSGSDRDSGAETAPHRRRRLRRFRVTTLDAPFAHNTSVSAALRLGVLLESILECLLGVEHAMAAAKTSLSSLNSDAHVGRDVVRWLDVFVHHRDDFFHWVSSGKDTSLRVGDPRFVLALAARVSLGCAFCHLALRHYVSDQSSSLHGRIIHQRVWELLESQLSLARLWRKFSSTMPMADVALLQKDQQLHTTILQAVASTIRPYAAQLLRGVEEILRAEPSVHSHGASLDGVLFVLDAYTHSLVSLPPQKSSVANKQLASEVRALVRIYTATASPAFADETEHTVVRFTTYGETLATQFPVSMRHLVVPDSATTLAVTLDTRAAEELASRVCVALSKSAVAMAQRHQFYELLDALAPLVPQASVCHSEPGVLTIDRIASRLLDDVKCVMNNDGFGKFRLAGVALVRKLIELLPTKSDSDRTDNRGDTATSTVANAAYELLCDHVVHQPPLLRALLALSFPPAPVRDADLVIDRAAAVLAACGFQDHAVVDTEEHGTEKTIAKKSSKRRKDGVPLMRRRRLRQISDDDESDEDDGAEDGGNDNTNTTTSVEENSSGQSIGRQVDASVPVNRQHQPRFTTAASQRAALTATLNVLESLHARTMPLLAALARVRTSSGGRVDCITAAATASVLQAARIQSLVASSVFASSDISWINTRTLAKLSSIVEAAVRVGKQCCVSCRSPGYPSDGDHQRQLFVQGFKASVAVSVRGRAWLALLRDAATQPSVKSKLSATILKLDVFLLDVPTLVTSLMKAETVPLTSKRDLRVFLSSVEADLALSTSMATSASVVRKSQPNKTSKRHLVGVVPIVHTKRRKRLRSRHAFIDSCLADEDGDDAFADLEDFIA